MRKKFALMLTAGVMLTAACDTNRPPIAEDKCAEVIFDIHKADAVLQLKELHDINLGNDSLSYYNYIFQKHGVTRKDFLESIDWYVKHPDKYNSVYKRVLKILAKFEEDETSRYTDTTDRAPNDIWDMKRVWHLPYDGDRNPVAFNIPIHEPGVYTLGADVTYYPDDKTSQPRMTLIVEYEDGTITENTVIDILKDGKERHVEVMLQADSVKKAKCVRGWVLDHSSDTESKHIDCYNITLLHTKD